MIPPPSSLVVMEWNEVVAPFQNDPRALTEWTRRDHESATMTLVPSMCPCGTGRPYPDCCRPLHDGPAVAPTAVRLMRSRYTAFALAKREYLLDTWHPSTRPSALELDPTVRWVGLEILSTEGGSLLENRGTVEFLARYRRGGESGVQQERSRFLRVGSRWLYVGPS